MNFSNLETVTFADKLKAAAKSIYKKIWPGCFITDLSTDNEAGHPLDVNQGIDLLLSTDNHVITIQEKYREHKFLVTPNVQISPPNPDFTMEVTNAAGTRYEAPGEWDHLNAELYFYGWSNSTTTDFEKWVILEVKKLKEFVTNKGGWSKIGCPRNNRKHGKAAFYAVPITKLSPCFFMTYKNYHPITKSFIDKSTATSAGTGLLPGLETNPTYQDY